MCIEKRSRKSESARSANEETASVTETVLSENISPKRKGIESVKPRTDVIGANIANERKPLSESVPLKSLQREKSVHKRQQR